MNGTTGSGPADILTYLAQQGKSGVHVRCYWQTMLDVWQAMAGVQDGCCWQLLAYPFGCSWMVLYVPSNGVVLHKHQLLGKLGVHLDGVDVSNGADKEYKQIVDHHVHV